MFVEKDEQRAQQLRRNLDTERSHKKVSYRVFPEDSNYFTRDLLHTIPQNSPVFFFIDPYGHPISIPTINDILQRRHSEIFLNLMWFRINMDLNNPKASERLNQMFGHSNWSKQPFCLKSKKEREEEFLKYFCSQVRSKYHFHFRIRFDPEDKTPGRSKRTKSYLIHFCNHPKAILLMKEVMWKLGDEEGTFDYSASSQGVLFSSTPTVDQLTEYLKKNYLGTGKSVEFMQLRIETYRLPFIEKHYRDTLKRMEFEKLISVDRRVSKKNGIRNGDFINFI